MNQDVPKRILNNKYVYFIVLHSIGYPENVPMPDQVE